MNSSQFELMKRMINEHTAEHASSPEKARAYLVKLGTHTPDGDLTPEYGGPPREGEQDRREPEAMVSQALARAERDTSPESLAKAASWIERAAGLGEPRGMVAMADWLDRGVHYDADPRRANGLLIRAAGLGSAEATFRLGERHEKGIGGAVRTRDAYLHYLEAALRGHLPARGEVARCLEHGIGVGQDADAAEIWRGRP